MSRGLEVATMVSAGGCALAGGVFFAFSSFVMTGLERLPPAAGVAAMQSINRAAVSPAFMAALFGTGAACAGVAVWSAVDEGEVPTAWVAAGAALYLVGAIGVTIARNVPLNDALAALDPAGPAAPARWRGYLRGWTAWNHLRAASCLGGAALLAAAALRGG